jgi:heme oxygenase (biliverdin-IX-beta and delta-forming)
MSIMQQLKHTTKPYHDQLESNPYSTAMMNGTISPVLYRTLLRKFYSFYLPMEARLSQANWSSVEFDFEARRKAPALRRDLIALGDLNAEIDALPLCADLPDVSTMPRALGSLYVFEGATLGGQLILRQMQEHFGYTPQHGCAFFSSYGAEIGIRWKQFGRLVEACATTSDIEHEIVDAACQTFIKFDAWIAQVQPWQADFQRV